jgi:hypothetical protein
MTRLRNFVLLIVAAIHFAAHSEPTTAQLALGSELAELLQTKSQFDAYLEQCKSPEGSTFDPKFAFSNDPSTFGGVSPQSAYWPEIEALYRKYQEESCKYITPEKFNSYIAEQYATRLSEGDLKATISFYKSPIGRRFSQARSEMNRDFQAFATNAMLQIYRGAYRKVQAEVRTVMNKYKNDPR